MKKGKDLEGVDWSGSRRKPFSSSTKRSRSAAQAWQALRAWRPPVPEWVKRLDWGPLLSVVLIICSAAWFVSMILNLVTHLRGRIP